MDKETLISLAKDAGLPMAWISDSGVLSWLDLETFANLIIAHEREGCAKALEGMSNAPDMQAYAAAIRSRT